MLDLPLAERFRQSGTLDFVFLDLGLKIGDLLVVLRLLVVRPLGDCLDLGGQLFVFFFKFGLSRLQRHLIGLGGLKLGHEGAQLIPQLFQRGIGSGSLGIGRCGMDRGAQ